MRIFKLKTSYKTLKMNNIPPIFGKCSSNHYKAWSSFHESEVIEAIKEIFRKFSIHSFFHSPDGCKLNCSYFQYIRTCAVQCSPKEIPYCGKSVKGWQLEKFTQFTSLMLARQNDYQARFVNMRSSSRFGQKQPTKLTAKFVTLRALRGRFWVLGTRFKKNDWDEKLLRRWSKLISYAFKLKWTWENKEL